MKRFRVTESGQTVIDTETGLEWQRQVDGKQYTYTQAKACVKNCRVGNANDWRLPTREELLGLLIPTSFGLTLDSEAFPNTPKIRGYWTSSVASWYNNWMSVISLQDGTEYDGEPHESYYVRCVRDR